MIIFMVSILVLVLGILMFNDILFSSIYSEEIGGLIIFSASLYVLTCFFFITYSQVEGNEICLQYEQDRLYIESIYDEDVISLDERMKVVDLIMKDNRITNKFKIRSNSLLYNWFYSKDVGELELFDVTKITNIKNEIILQEK